MTDVSKRSIFITNFPVVKLSTVNFYGWGKFLDTYHNDSEKYRYLQLSAVILKRHREISFTLLVLLLVQFQCDLLEQRISDFILFCSGFQLRLVAWSSLKLLIQRYVFKSYLSLHFTPSALENIIMTFLF